MRAKARPVIRLARDGEQMLAALRYCTSFEPWAAMASRCGVREVGCPKQPRSP